MLWQVKHERSLNIKYIWYKIREYEWQDLSNAESKRRYAMP